MEGMHAAIDSSGADPADETATDLRDGVASLLVHLRVADPEVLEELRRFPTDLERNEFALRALRVGVLSLKAAQGQVDAAAIREEGQKVVSDVRELLSTRSADLTNMLSTTLAHYFDPTSGVMPQRVKSLVEKDGELERVLRSHVGSDDSQLAKALTAHVGTGSPVFDLLSPDNARGLRAQVQQTIEEALAQQRETVLREFSLDRPESALSRLVKEVGDGNGVLTTGLQARIDLAMKEFSLDQPNSALSRLVGRVEAAQKEINRQFSADNETSALNTLTRILGETQRQIGANLTLDDDQSALSRLKRELETTLEALARRNNEFHNDVRATLDAMKAQRREAEKSTRHGLAFEAMVIDWAMSEIRPAGDIVTATGNTTGAISHCKVGDVVVEMGLDSAAPGERIVIEAKEDRSYDLKKALEEADTARKNRGAQVCIFALSKATASGAFEPFARHGNDIVVIWDPDDRATDLRLKVAYSLAKALVIRSRRSALAAEQAFDHIAIATRAIEKQANFLDDVETSAKTTVSAGTKIGERAQKMRAELNKQVAALDEALLALKSQS